MALTYPPNHYEQATPIGSTYDALRDVWWWINGSHPTVPNGIAWPCVECWDGTNRDVPTGGSLANLPAGRLWKPGDPAPATLPQGAWAVFESLGGAVAATWQCFVRMEASSQAGNSLITLADWSVGGGTGASPTLPATIIGQPASGDGDGRFTNQPTYIWSVILDEGMFIMRMFNPSNGGGSDFNSRWTYMGEVDPINNEADDPRPFITPRNTALTLWSGAFSHVKLSPVDQLTVCNVRNYPWRNITQNTSTTYNDLGAEYLCNVGFDADDPAGDRHIVGYARNVGSIDETAPRNRATAGYTPTDYRFEVWGIATGFPSPVTLWPPGTALPDGHTVVTEESVPSQLIPVADSGGGGDTTRPEVVYVDPIAGTQITPSTAITIDITDDSGGFANIQLRVRYPNADPVIPTESIYGGDELAVFETLYTSSTITPISNGFRFVLTRDGGWPSTPVFLASPIDSSGNTT